MTYFEHKQEVETDDKTREEVESHLKTEREKLQQEKLAFEGEKKILLSQK